MSTTPRFTSAVADQPPDFSTVLQHQPELLAAFWRLYGIFWSQGALDHRAKEVARIRNARVTNCGF
jgi:hypothetical protein